MAVNLSNYILAVWAKLRDIVQYITFTIYVYVFWLTLSYPLTTIKY